MENETRNGRCCGEELPGETLSRPDCGLLPDIPEISSPAATDRGNKTRKPISIPAYILISFSGTFVKLLLLYLTLIAVIKMFSVNSRGFILFALGATSVLVAYSQGVGGGIIICLSPMTGGGIASLPLNILCVKYLLGAGKDSFLIFFLLAVIAANLISAVSGFRFGIRTHDFDLSDMPILSLLFLYGFILIPIITLIAWSIIILILRHGFGLI